MTAMRWGAIAALLLSSAPAQAITNGSDDTGDPAVVTFGACSGTLIAPRVVLTAGHCIWGQDFASQRVRFGEHLASPAQERLILEGRVHPDFDATTLANDIGVLLLDLPPDGVDPVPMFSGPFGDAQVGATVRLVGFGITAPNDPPEAFGTKRQGTATVTAWLATAFVDQPAPSATCQGDSGGAVLLDGALAGVISQADTGCRSFGVRTRVDAYRQSFIEPYIASIQPGAAGIGEPCVETQQCASGACAQAPDDPNLRYCTADCAGAADCPATMLCIDRRCRFMGPTPGALGAACDRNADCDGWLCVGPEVGAPRICSIDCVASAAEPCPIGYRCGETPNAPGSTVCLAIPAAAPDGGCSEAGVPRSGIGVLALLLVALLVRSRFRP